MGNSFISVLTVICLIVILAKSSSPSPQLNEATNYLTKKWYSMWSQNESAFMGTVNV